jgi:hypothetical protein
MEHSLEDSGLEVFDLRSDAAFEARDFHSRDIEVQMAGLQRLSRAFLESPETVLQELVNVAVELCSADSAGISIEIEDGSDAEFYRWIATAGVYSGFLNSVLPREPSACGVCLERGHAQRFTVSQRFFDILGVRAPLVTDGLLLPWKMDETRGTIYVMAHGRSQAFDPTDARLMTMLADFAAMGYRQQRQQKRMMAQERSSAAAEMAHRLAHEINNPLQSMTNAAYLLAQGHPENDTKALGLELSKDIERLSSLVRELLSLPFGVSAEGK